MPRQLGSPAASARPRLGFSGDNASPVHLGGLASGRRRFRAVAGSLLPGRRNGLATHKSEMALDVNGLTASVEGREN